MARTPGSAEQNERRRRRAIEIVFTGKRSQISAAKELKVTLRSVQSWVSAYRNGGWSALKSRKTPGRPKKLNAKQRKTLERILLKGARAAGFENDLWTSKRILDVIDQEFGVVYHVHHVPRLLASMGWSAQRPQREAVEKDAKKIEEWVRVEWRRIKKKAKKSVQRSSLPMKAPS